MPIYDYVCDACDKEFEEKVVKFEPLQYCPFCGSEKLRQVYHPSTHVYKCAGFNITDARGITGKKRSPNIKVGVKGDLSPAEQERME